MTLKTLCNDLRADSLLTGAYEPPKAARSVHYVERHLHLRAFSDFRIRIVLDYGK